MLRDLMMARMITKQNERRTLCTVKYDTFGKKNLISHLALRMNLTSTNIERHHG